ncbi:hypothetical protein [Trueperella pecoris]|uniref:Uncharacterized protein n=1 Tax=Trueperella pecoris TaxID=2733571 RepID=A0A7M1QVX6_9ACTO|nr:hypothetical protein [Trueperella pecoris]QOQ38197.1 hypothetical protein HLG82_01195 [Trueperella pecoris]QOR45317.1 hypothetical protein INS88_08615 [Trueperella pecoris]QTG75193.1 hypothetical protein J4179_08230 [Trueperella pecoris]
MWINKYERDLILGLAGVLVLFFVISATFSAFATDRVQVSFFSSNWIGEIRAATEEKTVWNSVAGVFSFMPLASGFLAGYYTAQVRAYLGAGMTRMQVFMRLTRLALLVVGLLTTLIAIFWGVSSFVKKPELTGVNLTSLAMIPLWLAATYMATMCVVALFLRFVWWKVVIGSVVVMNSVIGLTLALTSVHGWQVHLNSEAVAMAVLLAALLCWISTWALIRELPIRRG